MAKQIVKTLNDAKQLWPEIPVGKAKNLINQKYNNLTVLYRTQAKDKNKTNWVCKCDCGNYCSVNSYQIQNNHTQSCGCFQKIQTSDSNLKDLINKQFYKLTVIKRVGTDNNRRPLWECQCECGDKTIVASNNLLSGHTKSCGCEHKDVINKYIIKDLTNQQFGFLTALEPTNKREHGCVVWKCKCNNCGKITEIRSTHLTNNDVKSCGCIVSYGELEINKILITQNINFKTQYSFTDLICKAPLRFDFAFFNENNQLLALLEYQGEQHYKTNSDFGLQQRTVTDKMKKEYCQQHNIQLFEIKYNENIRNKLEEILGELYGITRII